MAPAAALLPQKPLDDSSTKAAADSSANIGDSSLAHMKEGSSSDARSCVSSAGEAAGSVKESDMDHDSLTTEQSLLYPWSTYYGCYYPGSDGCFGELNDQQCQGGADGMEIQYPAVQADNGSLLYFMPGYQPSFDLYSPYIPVVTVGVDGQYTSEQMYPQGPIFPPSIASPGYFPSTIPYGTELMAPTCLWDPGFFFADGFHGGAYGTIPDAVATKGDLSSHDHARLGASKLYPSPQFSKSQEHKGSAQSLDTLSGQNLLNKSKPANKDFHQDATNPSDPRGYVSISKLSSHHQAKSRYIYPSGPLNVIVNQRGWSGSENLKSKSKASNIDDSGLVNEQDQCCKAASSKGALVSGGILVGTLDAHRNQCNSFIKRDQYNLPDFQTKYDHAMFFVIKSYSEDDIHKSIKYNVWASTPNGNKRLDGAYRDAQAKTVESGIKCPVFLFFSVNASGQFCGMAEMIGHVDFTKNMDFWQQDKWNGFFPVKWHIIKDVPNPQLRHVILENNDNKPVTNSRDTQEVRFPQGIEMLKIFKKYILKTSILDDFDFYESREKAMQDKRVKPGMHHFDHQKRVDEVLSKVQSIDLSAVDHVEQPETGQGVEE